MKRFKAFTLAEVLITLGVIGVVAGLTFPSLIQNYRNKVVESRLKKFYSAMNQAVIMAENDYGDKKIWFEDVGGAEFDEEGNPVPGSSNAEIWFNKYFSPYLKTLKETKTLANGTFAVYFSDGSTLAMLQHGTTRDWLFYPGNMDKCLEQPQSRGRCEFSFIFNPISKSSKWTHHYNKGFEPYKYDWDGQLSSLYTQSKYACKDGTWANYCTAIIQLNGWKIPKDYPYKVTY